MGEVVLFQRPSDKKARLRRPSRLLAHLNGAIVELTELTLSGKDGGAVELLSYSDIGVEAGDRADLRLPRPSEPTADRPPQDAHWQPEQGISLSALGGASEFSAPISVEVVRCSPGTRSFGARFTGLSQAQISLIEGLISPSPA